MNVKGVFTTGRITIRLILLMFLSSCATMNINGVSLKKPQKRIADPFETAVLSAGFIVGFAAVTHFKEPKKDK